MGFRHLRASMSSFTAIGSQHYPALQAQVTVYQHAASGARHVHIATDDEDRAFLIAFPTLPLVGDGRAHVLEHLLLCGSRRYPVRDPFFSMMSRSLSTFMNAMTYPDRTVYPFSTPDRSDYFNLMDVYLDATFFPRLDPLDFRQEAWRPVLEGGQLQLQGVVLNEMKGNYADPGRHLYLGLNRELLPGSTYAVDSGGDPLQIPGLTHADLVAFHAEHYHPSQAVFMTWGDMDPAEVQQRIERQVLSAFADRRAPIPAPTVQPWSGLREVVIAVPATPASQHDHRLQMAWRLGREADLDAVMRARLLETVLLAQGGGMLREAIEAAGFGRLSDHTGLDASTTEILLHVGMAGLEPAQLADARRLITQTLEIAAATPLPPELLQAGVRELRFAERRNVKGVQRLIGLAQAAVRHQDLLAVLDTDAALARLEQAITEPGFVQRQIQALLGPLPTLVAHIRPELQFLARRDEAAERFTQDWQARMTAAERATIEADSARLASHQNAEQPDLDAVLPRIQPADVERQARPLLPLAPAVWHDHALSLPTNGLSHGLVKFDLSAAPEADWPWLDLLAELLPQLGANGMSHQAAATWRRLRVAQMRLQASALQVIDGSARLEVTLQIDALREEQAAIPEVAAAWLQAPDFDDTERLRYLLQERLQSRLANLADEAPQLAMAEARAQAQASARIERAVHGLPSLAFEGQLQQALAQPEGLQPVQAALRRVHALLLRSPRVLLCAGIEGDAARLLDGLSTCPGPAPTTAAPAATPATTLGGQPAPGQVTQGVLAPAQVNHCSALWSVPALGHADAPALAVLAQLLQQQLLHPLLREQGGAYGAHAAYDATGGVFLCASMSDPRLAATFADMQTALDELQTREFTPVMLDEAILSVIKRLDPPVRGLAQLAKAWHAGRAGVTDAQRAAFRLGVLGCSLDDLRRVARQHLPWAAAHRAAALGWPDQDSAGLQVLDLMQRAREAGLATA